MKPLDDRHVTVSARIENHRIEPITKRSDDRTQQIRQIKCRVRECDNRDAIRSGNVAIMWRKIRHIQLWYHENLEKKSKRTSNFLRRKYSHQMILHFLLIFRENRRRHHHHLIQIQGKWFKSNNIVHLSCMSRKCNLKCSSKMHVTAPKILLV